MEEEEEQKEEEQEQEEKNIGHILSQIDIKKLSNSFPSLLYIQVLLVT